MQKDTRRLRVLLADDFPQILEQVERLLSNEFHIIGFARDGGEALELCLALNPDILLLDISMPILCGLEVASRLKELRCGSKIIFVTVQEDRDYLDTAFSQGASAYVLKCRIGTDLLPAIDAALNGSTFTSPFQAHIGTGFKHT
jgi:DNA-binding NarL/FixJ family response regulator